MKNDNIEFIKGAWYRYENWYIKYSHTKDIGGIHDSGTFVGSEQLVPGSTVTYIWHKHVGNFGAADASKELVTDLSVISDYLPDGHPDKIVKLYSIY